MNLFARILSHGFALLIVAMIAIGLVYRGDLFPEWELPGFLQFQHGDDDSESVAEGTVSRETAEIDMAPTDEGGVAEEPVAPSGTAVPSPSIAEQADLEAPAGETAAEVEPATAVDAGEETGTTPTPADTTSAPPADDEDVAAASDAAEAAGVETADADTAAAAVEPVEPAPAEVEPAEPAPAEPVSAEAAQANEATDTVAPASTASPYQLLAAAREAYWLRDYDLAEQHYQALIELEPDNPDGYGELGNMYFSQGRWEEASAAYFEAGRRLADEGVIEQARQLVDVIRGLQGPQAEELAEYISRAGSGP